MADMNRAIAKPRSTLFPVALIAVLFLTMWGNSLLAQTAEIGPPPEAPSIVGALALSAPEVEASESTPTWLNTSRRAIVLNSFNQKYLPTQTNITLGWTGTAGTCAQGTTLPAYRDAVEQRLNWYRSMAGVPPHITLDPDKNSMDQQAALMMSVNRALSHSPPANWTCYTPDGATAAGNSSLCLSNSPTYLQADPGCVRSYMWEDGSHNTAVGHRRWILYPQTRTMGTGDVPATGSYYSANALWFWDSNFDGPRPATRDLFVAWPPKGYVPASLVFERWSFSYPGADFRSAQVSMICNGQTLALTQLPVADGYGENALVWEAGACPPSAGADSRANVIVSNVLIGGSSKSFTYTVRPFDPAVVITDRIGVYGNGLWQIDTDGDGTSGSSGDRSFFLGWPGAVHVTGDWNGDGKTKAGVYSEGIWFLDYDGNGAWDGGVKDLQIGWGWPGATPFAGDWNGDGKTEIGVYSGGFWFLDYNGDFLWQPGGGDKQVGWGWEGVKPLTGDWNGDGRTKIGVYKDGFWFLDYDGSYIWDGGVADKQVGWGWPGVQVIVGDWGGDGRTKIGVYAGGRWFLDYDGDYSWDGGVVDRIGSIGWEGTTPIVGDWNGDGAEEIGAFINGYWYLDYNNNGIWDGGGPDRVYAFGQSGDKPIVGRW